MKKSRFGYSAAIVDGKWRVVVTDSNGAVDAAQFLKPPASYAGEIQRAASCKAVLATVPQSDDHGLFWPDEATAARAAKAATKGAKEAKRER